MFVVMMMFTKCARTKIQVNTLNYILLMARVVSFGFCRCRLVAMQLGSTASHWMSVDSTAPLGFALHHLVAIDFT